MSQVVITSNTNVATTSSTQIALNGNITVNSDLADLSKATLILVGTDQDLRNGRNSTATALAGLIVDGGGSKNLFGTWEVAGSITFNNGEVVPQTGSNGKLTHTLAVASPGDIVINNPLSFVNGSFYSKGTGTRFFPIGNNAGYFPSQLSSVTQGDVEVGMRVVNQDAALTYGSEILSIFDQQYWELLDPSQTLAGPIVALSNLGAASYIEVGVGTVVIGAPNSGGAGESVGGSASGDFIIGSLPIRVTDRIFTLGKISSDQVKVSVHNVVTPFVDNANDYLFIDNIDVFPLNKVMLLDRWGGLVKEWVGYSNALSGTDPAYDLSKIVTGNYICVVEYTDGNSTKKLSQMVTIVNR
jgi:hypothetical protein